MNHDHSPPEREPRKFWGSGSSIGLLIMGAAAGYFLLTEHRAHLFGALPYLLLLACLLMHFFMHRGHGGHGRGRIQSEGEAPGRKPSPGAGEQR